MEWKLKNNKSVSIETLGDFANDPLDFWATYGFDLSIKIGQTIHILGFGLEPKGKRISFCVFNVELTYFWGLS